MTNHTASVQRPTLLATVPGLVSVIIPTYQRAYILRGAIASALSQTYRPLEVVVVDDGSTDDTRQVVAEFGDQVRYQFQPNAGVSAARNTGMRLAQGEFIAFLDSDDEWLPRKLDLQVAFLRHFPQLGMVWTDMAAIDDSRETISAAYLRTMYHAYHYVRTEDIFRSSGRIGDVSPDAPPEMLERAFYHGDVFSPMILGNLVHTSTVLLRRDRQLLVGDFDEKVRHGGEDYEYHLATCSYGPVGFLDVSMVLYRVGADDQFVTPQTGIHFARANLATLTGWLDKAGNRVQLPKGLLRERVADSYTWLGCEELKQGISRAARRHLWRSLTRRPTHRRTAMFFFFSLLPPAVFRTMGRIRTKLRGAGRVADVASATSGRASRSLERRQPHLGQVAVERDEFFADGVPT